MGSKLVHVGQSVGYHLRMSKTSVEVDQDIAREAADILGTSTLRATIDAALHEVVYARRRLELIALFSQEGRFDFDAAEQAWGSDD
jgi:Arc/MetJ family transcription regulator